MNKIKFLIALFLIAGVAQSAIAKENIENPEGRPDDTNTGNNVSLRNDCTASVSQTDLDINNVRARLLGGGDLWWDLSDGRYIIPNVEPGEKEISSIFAAALWIGGFDAAGNLKIAAQTYRQTGDDFWPGPIDNATGETEQSVCQNWDRHFTVLGEDIDQLVADYLADDNGDGVPDNTIEGTPAPSLLQWPARGNPYFEQQLGFALPNQDLAPFYDEDGDGIYDPNKGDIPQIGVIGCDAQSLDDVAYADQMVWWVYNDKGNIHTETGGAQIGMEVQALAFGFATNNPINNMSFYKYTLLNKATDVLDSTYVGQWVDPDLGCWNNDFVGCQVEESLGIVYNGTSTDPDCSSGGGLVNGYGTEVPMLGVDYFRGPRDENGDELGMGAFVYYNNDFSPTGNPEEAEDFYGYLSGSWKDDTPIEEGGDGYLEGTGPTPYMFPSDPSDNSAGTWSECSVSNAPDDRRFVQSSGPFTLEPGTTNEVIVGAVWVSNVAYPCPSFNKLLRADRIAQGLFDNCFDITDGPDAPDLSIIELDRELVITITNGPSSNNFNEEYFEKDPLIPPGYQDSVYNFQGYVIYQLSTPTPPCDNFQDCDEAKIVANVDIRDGVAKIVNYEPFEEEVEIDVFTPIIKVDGDDDGIRHSFNIRDDLFAVDNPRLVNHKKYYYTAIAYAYNNYVTFDPVDPENTQQTPYLQGRRNITTYTAIPHKNDPEFGGAVVNASYGDVAQITRLDGEGIGGNSLDLTQESVDAIVANTIQSEITYKENAGPFEVKVYDPLAVKGGTYTVSLEDTIMTDSELLDPFYWVLEGNGVSVTSEKPVGSPFEQLIPELGLSVNFEQTLDAFDDPLFTNGFVSANTEYADPAGVEWYGAMADNEVGTLWLTNFIKNGTNEPDIPRDPENVYGNTGILDGTWYPFAMTTSSPDPAVQGVGNGDYFLTPHPATSNASLGNFIRTRLWGTSAEAQALTKEIANVDIVLTSDKSKWSRCVVLNTFSNYYETELGFNPDDVAGQYGIRSAESVGKDGQPDGTGTGMSWFPGYAVDVETGRRLNVFFGENTFFDQNISANLPDNTGADMLWNPSPFRFIVDQPDGSLAQMSYGAQHYIYVAKTTYDECADIRTALEGSIIQQIDAWTSVSWTSAPIPNVELNSIEDGLIPNDVTFKLRVNNPFQTSDPVADNNGYPKYQFTFDTALDATVDDVEVAENALDLIRAVPNPYYGFSPYESSEFEQIVKITNLPPQATISIYSLDGQLIRRYNRNAQPSPTRGSDQLITSQEWDLKNASGITVASGVYIIHIDASASGLGEKIIKWFGGVREFDATGL